MDNIFIVIYYAGKTLNFDQMNYTSTEKELLALIYAFDKFRIYLIGTHSIIYIDHTVIRYLFRKKDLKPHFNSIDFAAKRA